MASSIHYVFSHMKDVLQTPKKKQKFEVYSIPCTFEKNMLHGVLKKKG